MEAVKNVPQVEKTKVGPGARFRALATHYLQQPRFVLCALALLLATQVVPWWGPTPDASCYLSIARSMAAGGPITNLGSPKLHYSPGYPALISPAFLTGDRPFLLLAFMQWGFTVLLMLGIYRWATRWFPTGALWITALVMVNVGLWILARCTLSEMAFMATLMGCANALDRLSAATARRDVILWTLIAALGVTIVSLIRPVGVLIVAGYGSLALLMAYKHTIGWTRAITTTFAIGLPASAAVLAFLVYETRIAKVAAPTDSVTYLDEFHVPDVSLASQLVEGARLRITEIGRIVMPGMNKAYGQPRQWLNVNMFIYTPLFLALCWSWWRIVRDGPNALLLFLPFYFGLHVCYPADQGTRYLVPLAPLLAACVWRLALLAPPARQVRVLGTIVALHLCVTLAVSVRETAQLYDEQPRWAAVDQLMEIIEREPAALVTCGAPEGVWEMTQISGNRPVHWIADPKRLANHTGWVIAATNYDLGQEFVEHARAGELKLLKRDSTNTAKGTGVELQR